MKLLLNIFLLVFALPLWAQNVSEEEISLETLQNQSLLPTTEKGAFIIQIGDSNQASVQSRDEQLAKVIQEGNLNVLNLDLSGSDNNATVVQRGSQNEYNLNLEGTENELTILQEGDANKVTQAFENADGLEVELIQIGGGHEIIQVGGGNADSPIQVVQQGSPMKVVIEKKN